MSHWDSLVVEVGCVVSEKPEKTTNESLGLVGGRGGPRGGCKAEKPTNESLGLVGGRGGPRGG